MNIYALKKYLEKAFIAGYENPIENMDSCINEILQESEEFKKEEPSRKCQPYYDYDYDNNNSYLSYLGRRLRTEADDIVNDIFNPKVDSVAQEEKKLEDLFLRELEQESLSNMRSTEGDYQPVVPPKYKKYSDEYCQYSGEY